MQSERLGDLSLRGEPLTVLGTLIKPGDRAVEVILNDKGFDGSRVLLESTAGKVRLINAVSSLGTSLCDAHTRRFNQATASLGEDGIVRYLKYVSQIG